MKRIESRSGQIDTERCVQQTGGRYDLVLVAAQRLRELKRQHRDDPTRYVTCVDALTEVQNGQVKLEDYLAKVK